MTLSKLTIGTIEDTFEIRAQMRIQLPSNNALNNITKKVSHIVVIIVLLSSLLIFGKIEL